MAALLQTNFEAKSAYASFGHFQSGWAGRAVLCIMYVHVCMSVYLLVCALRLLTMDRTTVTSLTHTGPQPTSSPWRLVYPTAIATHSAITAPSG